jgi:hypothetical protein
MACSFGERSLYLSVKAKRESLPRLGSGPGRLSLLVDIGVFAQFLVGQNSEPAQRITPS